MIPRELSCCRVCGATALRKILDLGSVAISDFAHDADPVYAPLTLVLCDPSRGGCSFLQLAHVAIDERILYRRYWYRSGTNEAMRGALADVVRSACAAVDTRDGDIVLDIGANDGTLLRSYQRNHLVLVGFDPAENLAEEARAGTDLIVSECFGAAAFRRHLGSDARARIVTSIAMFYDLDRPDEFVRDVAAVLETDGIWVVQMAYLPAMLSRNSFDNICHEHVGYYSLRVMTRVVEAHGLEVSDVERNDVNGGSFRLYVRHRNGADPPRRDASGLERVERLLAYEESLGLDGPEVYDAFARRIEAIRESVRRFVLAELARGKVFHVYGASTKGNTLLQYFGLDCRHFQMAADRSSDKWGLRTTATKIPIVSEESSRRARPHYYFVLPWAFRDVFLTREREFLDAGGRIVFPLPWPSFVEMTDGRLWETPLPEAAAPAVDTETGRSRT